MTVNTGINGKHFCKHRCRHTYGFVFSPVITSHIINAKTSWRTQSREDSDKIYYLGKVCDTERTVVDCCFLIISMESSSRLHIADKEEDASMLFFINGGNWDIRMLPAGLTIWASKLIFQNDSLLSTTDVFAALYLKHHFTSTNNVSVWIYRKRT